MLFNGQLVRHLRHSVENGTLRIEAGPTDYREFIGTNFANGHRGDELGWELYSNPLGISANVITSDGWLVYGRRNLRVACHPGFVHAFGGAVEAKDCRPDGSCDAFASIRRELGEELQLGDAEIEHVMCLGMIHDVETRQPEIIFDAHVRPTRDAIAARIGQDDEEHVGIECCRDQAEAVRHFVREVKPLAAITLGAILVHGRLVFGTDWYDRALGDA